MIVLGCLNIYIFIFYFFAHFSNHFCLVAGEGTELCSAPKRSEVEHGAERNF